MEKQIQNSTVVKLTQIPVCLYLSVCIKEKKKRLKESEVKVA